MFFSEQLYITACIRKTQRRKINLSYKKNSLHFILWLQMLLQTNAYNYGHVVWYTSSYTTVVHYLKKIQHLQAYCVKQRQHIMLVTCLKRVGFFFRKVYCIEGTLIKFLHFMKHVQLIRSADTETLIRNRYADIVVVAKAT